MRRYLFKNHSIQKIDGKGVGVRPAENKTGKKGDRLIYGGLQVTDVSKIKDLLSHNKGNYLIDVAFDPEQGWR